ncbi:MAG: leucine-rich repeat domain-containing protein [Holosporales bacterium]|jgi:hypothetical protein|nr:leucine-rich repeat domain-containing protein [Holosporales bacterium]
MKKIIITSVVALLIPEIANCMRRTDSYKECRVDNTLLENCMRFTLDGADYYQKGKVVKVTASFYPSRILTRDRICIGGEVYGVLYALAKNGRNTASSGSVYFPSSIETIGIECFRNALRDALSFIIFEQNSHLKKIGYDAFSGCASLVSICIPFSLETIGEKCFLNCRSLSSVTFESGSRLADIGKDAIPAETVVNGCPFPIPGRE